MLLLRAGLVGGVLGLVWGHDGKQPPHEISERAKV